MKISLFSSLIIVCALTTLASAATVQLTAVADTDVRMAAEDYAHSTRTGMWVSSVSTNAMKGYMRFELPTDIDYVTSATLTLTRQVAGAWSPTYDIYGLDDDLIENDWLEINSARNPGEPYTRGLTWNNAPANDKTTANSFLAADSSMLSSFAVVGYNHGGSAGDTYSISGANLVNFLDVDSDGNVTFMIARNSGESTSLDVFGTKETGTAAMLSLTYEPVPEPISLALLGLGGLLIRRKK